MTSHCVVRFIEETRGRIAPTQLVKLKGEKGPFSPKSARDLPEDKVKVKWQKSTSGSFSSDGYFEAEVLAIAGSVKTAEAKAGEMGIKLFPGVLAVPLPAATEDSTSDLKSRRSRTRENENKSSSASKSSSKAGQSGSRSKSEQSGSRSKSEQSRSKSKSEQLSSRSKSDHSSSSPKADHFSSSPKAGHSSSSPKADHSSSSPKADRSSLTPKAESSSSPKSRAKSSKAGDRKRNYSKDSQSGTAPKIKRLKMSNISLERTSAQSSLAVTTNPLLKANDSENGNDAESKNEKDHSEDAFLDELTQADGNSDPDNPDWHGDENIGDSTSQKELLTLPKSKSNSVSSVETIADMNSESSISHSSSESDSESGEDDVSKLSSQKSKLREQLLQVKENLADAKRNLVLTNNLRLAHLKELKEIRKKNETLRKRNAALQDCLLEKHGSNARKTPPMIMTSKNTTDVPKSPKEKSSIDYEVKVVDMDSSEASDFKNSSPFSSPVKPIKSFTPSPKSEVKNQKNRKQKDQDDLKNPVVSAVCDMILKNLKGEAPLKIDKDGYIDFGQDLKIDKEGFERTLRENKGDMSKISKGMASLAWTTSERERRSLTGGKNNRFPNAPPKQAATPYKVNACLGVVKAHLLHQGDREGPGMALNLKSCRKAIGEKFSQDCAQAHKKKM